MSRQISNKWKPFLWLAVATACVWGQTVAFDFVWDDNYFIRDLPSVHALKNIPEMFYRIEAQAVNPHHFVVFRPLRTAHYAVLCFLGGQAEPQPWLYHLSNVLWHGATVLLLFVTAGLLLRRFSPQRSETENATWAFGIALAFAVHPVVSEVVCWAKSLDDILAAFFTLAALREVLQPPEKTAAQARALLFFALAVYSKESAIPFAGIVPVIFWKSHQLPLKKTVQRTIPFLLIALIYVVHRHFVIGRSSQTAPISGSYGQTLVDMLPVALTYFRLLFGVPPFCIDYSYLQGGAKICSLPVLSGLFLLVLLIGVAVGSWRTTRWRLTGFGLLWTGFFLLPVSNLLPMMQYLAERFLYLPLMGWLLAMAAVLAELRRPRVFQCIGLGVVLLWGAMAWQRSWIWHDELTLFIHASQQNPNCRRTENNAVAAIFELPQIKQVCRREQGQILMSAGLAPEALDNATATFSAALQIFPADPTLLGALAMTKATAGQPERALPLFEKAAALAPKSTSSWLNCARAALAANQLVSARTAVDQALALDPKNRFALELLLEYQWRTKQDAAALETARHWNQIAPDTNSAAALSQALRRLAAPDTQSKSGE